MSNHPIHELLSSTMENLKDMVDVNTIIGEPIVTQDGTTLIPISKVSVGFASGGTDFQKKNAVPGEGSAFGGGGGAGVTVSPVAFVVVSDGMTRILPVNEPADTSLDRILEMVPDVVNKVSGFFSRKKDKDDDENEF
jgi:sporulation protein YtfJ